MVSPELTNGSALGCQSAVHDLRAGDLSLWVASMTAGGIHRSREYFEQCLEENTLGRRKTFVARWGDEIAGFVHLIMESQYDYFREHRIPEINDLVVVPRHRRKGIATALIKACETFTTGQHGRIGLGVGLYADYGSAQQLYFSLGYKPDGKGIVFENKAVAPGSTVRVNDDLLLYLCKPLG